MTHDEFDRLIHGPMLQDRQSAIDVLKHHGWLLIPDVRVELVSLKTQGVFHSVKLDANTEADFAVYEILQGCLHWQFVLVGSPSASILDGSQLSAEFQHSLQQIEQWRDIISQNGIPQALHQPQPANVRTFVSFRIIIGQSQQQTMEEQAVVRQSQQNDLRIRSFNWILEKPVHYSEPELGMLDRNGSVGKPPNPVNL